MRKKNKTRSRKSVGVTTTVKPVEKTSSTSTSNSKKSLSERNGSATPNATPSAVDVERKKRKEARKQKTLQARENFLKAKELYLRAREQRVQFVPTFKTKNFVVPDDMKDQKDSDLSSQEGPSKSSVASSKSSVKHESELVRVVRFDERTRRGEPVALPRVVTVMFTHNRDTGVTKYGAVVWSQVHKGDEYNKKQELSYARARFEQAPVFVKLDPVPLSNAQLLLNLRSCVYRLGVSSNSRKYSDFSRIEEIKSYL